MALRLSEGLALGAKRTATGVRGPTFIVVTVLKVGVTGKGGVAHAFCPGVVRRASARTAAGFSLLAKRVTGYGPVQIDFISAKRRVFGSISVSLDLRRKQTSHCVMTAANLV